MKSGEKKKTTILQHRKEKSSTNHKIRRWWEREREGEDWLLNLRQLRFDGEVINRINISNLFGGKMIFFFFEKKRERWLIVEFKAIEI